MDALIKMIEEELNVDRDLATRFAEFITQNLDDISETYIAGEGALGAQELSAIAEEFDYDRDKHRTIG